MRKLVGAKRGSLICQFMAESVAIVLLASLLGALVAGAWLGTTPVPNPFGEGAIRFRSAAYAGAVLWTVAGALVVGALAGAYPAIYLSAVTPLAALVGQGSRGRLSARVREVLILLQFAASVAVVASTLTMWQQVRYLTSQPLGFADENRLVVKLRGADLIEQVTAIKELLMANHGVRGVAAASAVMGEEPSVTTADVDTDSGVARLVELNYLLVDDDFLDAMDMDLVEGRGFSSERDADGGRAVLVNEALVRKMGWQRPLGKRIASGDTAVVGVVRDFHFRSLHSPLEPFVFFRFSGDLSFLSAAERPFAERSMIIHLSDDHVAGTLDFVRGVFSRLDPAHPFEYRFLDDELRALYSSERRVLRLTSALAGIAIVIAGLGLVGLLAYMTEQRSREVGIRKVLGASPRQVVDLFARRVSLLVLSGAVLGMMISYPFLDRWLGSFAYRIDINAAAFLASALIAISIAMATAVIQTLGQARRRPADLVNSS